MQICFKLFTLGFQFKVAGFSGSGYLESWPTECLVTQQKLEQTHQKTCLNFVLTNIKMCEHLKSLRDEARLGGGESSTRHFPEFES